MTDPRGDGWIDLPARTQRALAEVDTMPPALRECVHEFGYPIVQTFRQLGLSDPNKIRAAVHAAWCGARTTNGSQRPGHGGKGVPSSVLQHLEWLLLQRGAQITATELITLLWRDGMVILPREPNWPMVNASIEATGHMGLVSKEEKHRGRLRAAIQAGASRLWPYSFPERNGS